MDYISIIGYIAGICTAWANLPQLIQVIRTKHTKDISRLMYIILNTGVFLWIIYGYFISDYPIMIANTITFLMIFPILIMKIKYK